MAKLDALYFDGACSLCRGEISKLKRVRTGDIEFIDIHDIDVFTEGLPSREALLRDLHLRRADGTWLTGIEANVAAWANTPVAWLLKPLLWRPIAPISRFAYRHWAERRYVRMGYGGGRCRSGRTE